MLAETMTIAATLIRKSLAPLVRTYVYRELPGWGRLYSLIDHDQLWQHTPLRLVRNRFTGYLTQQDVSKWAERRTYFLGRWHDLEMQLFIRDVARDTDTIVDVGANRGQFALFCAHLACKGEVLAFEPNRWFSFARAFNSLSRDRPMLPNFLRQV